MLRLPDVGGGKDKANRSSNQLRLIDKLASPLNGWDIAVSLDRFHLGITYSSLIGPGKCRAWLQSYLTLQPCGAREKKKKRRWG